MSENLNFKTDYYKITKLIEPNVIEVEGTWFIKLKGVRDSSEEELKNILNENNIVRVIPHSRSEDARIISDVWLGNTHVNRQFSNYKIDNFIQAFEYWNSSNSNDKNVAEDELIEAFDVAKPLINNSELEHSFNSWIKSRYPQRRTELVPSIDRADIKEEIQNQMIKAFNNWKEESDSDE